MAVNHNETCSYPKLRAKKMLVNILCKVFDILHRLGAEIFMHDEMQQEFAQQPVTFYQEIEELVEHCDIVIAIGGDGTIIHASKYASAANKPVLGINVGRLGYVAGLETNELCSLERLMDGDYTVEERMMLEVSFYQNGKKQTYQVLNDAIVGTWFFISHSGFNRFAISMKHVCQYRADGLIGSTQRVPPLIPFSAGGPVMDPTMEGILLTPICPHSIFGRTVVFGADTELFISATSQYNSDMILTLDGDCVAHIGRKMK